MAASQKKTGGKRTSSGGTRRSGSASGSSRGNSRGSKAPARRPMTFPTPPSTTTMNESTM